MRGERLTRTFVLALAGLAAFAVLRPTSPDPVDDVRAREAWFFTVKAHQDADYDLVVLGDSRALRGIAPSLLEKALPGRRIFNLAFNAGGMNREMYDAAESLLRPDAPAPAILLAPTSLAFQPFKRGNDQYHEYLAKPRDQVWLYRHAAFVAEWFAPVSPALPLRRLFGPPPRKILRQRFHAAGWIETEQTPADDLTDLTHFRLRLEGQHVDRELIDGFMARTRAWTRRGIRVFATIPPADPAREALEDSMLGFDPEAFRAAFVAAGGTWLDVPGTDYATFDGSHLTAPSARAYSRALGEVLRRHLGP